MDVIRVTTTEPQMYIIVSTVPWGQWTHWFGRRSHECRRDSGTCEGCKDGWPEKWQAYLHVTRPERGWEGFLEMTATAWKILEAQIKDGTTVRGCIVRLSRTKGGAKGRYLIEVLERRIPEDDLPPAKDPMPTLRMLWRAKKGPMPESR
jgi:hypothetical protein